MDLLGSAQQLPGSGPGLSLSQARQMIQQIKSQQMQPGDFGRPDPSTGNLTPVQASLQLLNVFQMQLIPSPQLSLAQKLSLIAEQRMPLDAFKRQDPSLGGLTIQQMQSLAQASLAQETSTTLSFGQIQENLAMLALQRMREDSFKRDDPQTGLFTAEMAKQAILQIINRQIIANALLTQQQKLSLLQSQLMQKDVFNRYDPRSGALSVEAFNQYKTQILNTQIVPY